MKKLLHTISRLVGLASLGIILLFGVSSMAVSYADNDDREFGEKADHERREKSVSYNNLRLSDVQQSAVYTEECGACHMAYPANLLPLESWKKIMGSLSDHFGEYAETDKQTALQITDYLQSQALPLRNTKAKVPMRITKLLYFKHKHGEIPVKMVKGNSKVGSFSQCNACHKNAEKGKFDEHSVSIPGYGRWDD